MTDATPGPRLRRTGSLSLMDGSSLLNSFATKFQGKRGAALPPGGPSLPCHSQSQSQSQSHSHSHRRKPMVIYYSSAAGTAPPPAPSAREDRGSDRSTDGDEDAGPLVRSSRRLSRSHTLDELDGFDVESAMANYASSFGPRGTAAGGRSTAAAGPSAAAAAAPSRRSSTLRRMSMRFSHSRDRGASTVPSGPSGPSGPGGPSVPSRADARARKYDVDWRDDRASACCQLCFSVFTTLSRRRHHCRLCGELVCGSCSPDQVALVDKFAGPKRACNACFALLEALAAAKDPRILRVDGTHHRYPLASASASSASSASASSASAGDGGDASASASAADGADGEDAGPNADAQLLLAPPTPRYRDRMAEVRRVMAAGEKSKRRGSNGRAGVMCVVPSAWVRQWLAFTENAGPASSLSSSSVASSPDFEPRSPSPSAAAAAPGPINNWRLLEFAQGRLAQRADATRDDGPMAGGADEDAAASPAELGFQLITTEVYEVFQRLYGGGPTVRVDMSSSKRWVVDIGPVLAALPAAKVSPTVERALRQRHAARADSDASSSSSASASASFSSASSPAPACVVTPTHERGSPTASSSGGTETSDEDAAVLALEPALSVTAVAKAEAAEGDAAASAMRSPSAATATAASAFALAMKQARLNAQRAIDERARGA